MFTTAQCTIAKLCHVCGTHLSDHRQRRKLHSDATGHILPMLAHTLSIHVTRIAGAGTVSEDAILQLLLHKAATSVRHFSPEKLMKLWQETRNVEELVLLKLSQCGAYRQVISATQSPIVPDTVPEAPASVGSPSSISAPAAKQSRCASSLTPRLSKPVNRQILFSDKQPDTQRWGQSLVLWLP